MSRCCRATRGGRRGRDEGRFLENALPESRPTPRATAALAAVSSPAVRAQRRVSSAQLPADSPPVLPGPHMLLTRSHTGSGMDAATLGRLFEPFFTLFFVSKPLSSSELARKVRQALDSGPARVGSCALEASAQRQAMRMCLQRDGRGLVQWGGGRGPRPCLVRSFAIASGVVAASSQRMGPSQWGQL